MNSWVLEQNSGEEEGGKEEVKRERGDMRGMGHENVCREQCTVVCRGWGGRVCCAHGATVYDQYSDKWKKRIQEHVQKTV
jgi:hypothetical protein